jgi:hypothetical protein
LRVSVPRNRRPPASLSLVLPKTKGFDDKNNRCHSRCAAGNRRVRECGGERWRIKDVASSAGVKLRDQHQQERFRWREVEQRHCRHVARLAQGLICRSSRGCGSACPSHGVLFWSGESARSPALIAPGFGRRMSARMGQHPGVGVPTASNFHTASIDADITLITRVC